MRSRSLYRPPAPKPLSPLRSLLRVIRQGDGDLLSLVPAEAYREPLVWLGYSRRSILLVNEPGLCRDILADAQGIFPKNDLMVGALEGLVGDSIFVSSGSQWRRQRRMIDPAFSQLRVQSAYASMVEAVEAAEHRLDDACNTAQPFSLDLAMSQLTADVICRTIFSSSLDSSIARDVFEDFLVFERGVASVNLRELILGKPWARIKQPESVIKACERIRNHLGELLDPRLEHPEQHDTDDIVAAIIAARDTQTGEPFSREELIDQLGVFFLAGHETTASVLTWTFFILAMRPDIAQRLQANIDTVVGDGPVLYEHIRRLPLLKNVFREALRLYPPITFLPRVALKPTRIGGRKVKRGAMIMISPWTAHRNSQLWRDAEHFDPDRYDNESSTHEGMHMSFGIGPRVCIGANFATVESVLILASLVRRYEFRISNAEVVRPVARLTTRPATEIQCVVSRRSTQPAEAWT